MSFTLRDFYKQFVNENDADNKNDEEIFNILTDLFERTVERIQEKETFKKTYISEMTKLESEVQSLRSNCQDLDERLKECIGDNQALRMQLDIQKAKCQDQERQREESEQKLQTEYAEEIENYKKQIKELQRQIDRQSYQCEEKNKECQNTLRQEQEDKIRMKSISDNHYENLQKCKREKTEIETQVLSCDDFYNKVRDALHGFGSLNTRMTDEEMKFMIQVAQQVRLSKTRFGSSPSLTDSMSIFSKIVPFVLKLFLSFWTSKRVQNDWQVYHNQKKRSEYYEFVLSQLRLSQDMYEEIASRAAKSKQPIETYWNTTLKQQMDLEQKSNIMVSTCHSFLDQTLAQLQSIGIPSSSLSSSSS